MAVDYVILNKDSSENGIIAINKSVFKSIAEITIDDLDHAERAEKSSFSKAVIAIKLRPSILFSSVSNSTGIFVPSE